MANQIYLMILALVWLAVIASGVLWLRFFFLCGTGRKKPAELLPPADRQRPFWTLADFLITFGALVFGLFLFSILFTQQGWIEAAPPGESGDATGRSLHNLIAGLAANSLAGIFAVTVTLLWLKAMNPNAVEELGIIPSRSGIRLGLRAALWILPPVGLISLIVSLLIPYEHPVLNLLAESPSLMIFAWMFLGTAIIAPFVEEFTFRVMLQGSLQRLADGPQSRLLATNTIEVDAVETNSAETVSHFEPASELADAFRPPRELGLDDVADSADETGAWLPTHYWPIVVTSLVFALMHLGQGAAPIPLFVLSLALGYLYRQTGKMTTPLIVHMVLNSITLCAEFTRIVAETG